VCPLPRRDRTPTYRQPDPLDLTRRAEKLMTSGGTIFAMSYHGANRVIENYGIMGPVKAALGRGGALPGSELGPRDIRAHAVSPGPLATRAPPASPISTPDGTGVGTRAGAMPVPPR
jgi:NAD(P)-dependent dehydrogenase (short-subunit alcohol dehydrogenase family)